MNNIASKTIDELSSAFLAKTASTFAEILIAEISRAQRYLGERVTEEQEQQLLRQSPQQLVSEAQLVTAAVALRQQTEVAEHMRRCITAQELKDGLHKVPSS